MNKGDYKIMIETILNDETLYSKVNINPEMKLQLIYQRLLQKYKIHMTDTKFDYLQNFEAKISNFYGLPKVL